MARPGLQRRDRVRRWTIQPRATQPPTKRGENTRASWFITASLVRGKSLEMRWRLMVITISMRPQYALLYGTIHYFSPRQGHEMETPFQATDLVSYPRRTVHCVVYLHIHHNDYNFSRWFFDCSTIDNIEDRESE